MGNFPSTDAGKLDAALFAAENGGGGGGGTTVIAKASAPVAGSNVEADISISVTWDTPFADTNYVVVCQLEVAIGNTNAYFLNSFSKTKDGITADIGANSSNSPTTDDRLVLHAMAIHA